MKKVKYEILKKRIPTVKLVSLTDRFWYTNDDELVPWLIDGNIFPQDNDIVLNTNISEQLKNAYYKWSGSEWNLITGSTQSYINGEIYEDYNLPILIENTIYNLGTMVEFDGNIEQIEQKNNFIYTGTNNVVTVYNTSNTNSIGVLVNSVFTINWGDGQYDSLPMMEIGATDLPFISHTYQQNGEYIIIVSIETPWDVNYVQKKINIPIKYNENTDKLGTLTFNVPYTDPMITQSQNYIEDYELSTENTNDTTITFRAIGKSRVDELKKYGKNNSYLGVTVYSGYTGYSLDGLYYIDNPDGETIISGSTESYYNDEIYNGMITRNEHFIGFIEEPTIYSDVFVERGKLSVTEKNFRLSEIESVGELSIYGNGYFNVRKQ